MSKRFKEGDRVRWQYWHVIGRNGHWVVKDGVFVRYIRKQDWIRNIPGMPLFCLVHFDGNKRDSRVMERDLRKVEG